MSTEMIVKSQTPIKSVSNVVQSHPKMSGKTPEHTPGEIPDTDVDFWQAVEPFELQNQPEFNLTQAHDARPEALDNFVDPINFTLPNTISPSQKNFSNGTIIDPDVSIKASDTHRNALTVATDRHGAAAGPTVLLGGDQSLVQYRVLGSRADPKILPPQTGPADPEIPRAKPASDLASIDRPSAPKVSQTVAQVVIVPGVTAEGQTLFQWGESMAEARPSTELTTEVRISAGSSAKSATPQFAAPAQITRQIADYIPAAMGKPVQIMLQPEELGRVRLSVSVSVSEVIVSILAERGETLDLMRRNIDQLQQDFQTLGFGTADFSFQSEGALSDAESDTDQDGDAEGPVISSDNGATILIQAEGLDMRL
jgi:hypothetical protein